MNKIFGKTPKSHFWAIFSIFWVLGTHLNILLKSEIWHFSYFMIANFKEKNKKKLMIQRTCIVDEWKNE